MFPALGLDPTGVWRFPAVRFREERKPMLTARGRESRNPFGVEDAPDPDGAEVTDFAAKVDLRGVADDPNARAWDGSTGDDQHVSIEGEWSSRWNGGVDGTIA